MCLGPGMCAGAAGDAEQRGSAAAERRSVGGALWEGHGSADSGRSTCLAVLRPLNQATIELFEEKRVSGSKAISLTKMLKHFIAGQCAQMVCGFKASLAYNLENNLADKFSGLEKLTSLSVATILDPRIKEVRFCNPTDTKMADERLTRECVSLMDGESPEVVAPTDHTATADGEREYNLWLGNFATSADHY